MKLTIDRTPFLAALSRVVGVVDRSCTIPVVRNVLMLADGDTVTLRATNLDMEATASVPADVAEGGAITLQALTLLEIVKNAPNGADISIVTGPDDPRAKVSFGRSRFQVPTEPAADFPVMPTPTDAPTITLPASSLAAMLDKAAWAQSTDAIRAYLCGVYVHTFEGRFRVVATMGNVLSVVVGQEVDIDIAGSIIPGAYVAQASRMLADVDAPATLAITSSQVMLTVGDATLVGKVLDGTYPDYRRIIPATNTKRLTVGREALSAAVRRALIMGTGKDQSVKIDFRPDSLSVTARSEDSGEALDEISAEYDGEDMRMGFNGGYITEALAHIAGDAVHFELGDASRPVIIREGGGLIVIGVQRA